MSGYPAAKDGDALHLEIKNIHDEPLYITVLNVDPSGEVSVIYPRAGEYGAADPIAPNVTMHHFIGLEGVGLERIRVIATKEKYPLFVMDSAVAEKASSRSTNVDERAPVKNVDNPLGALVRDLPVPKNRGYDMFMPPDEFYFTPVLQVEMLEK